MKMTTKRQTALLAGAFAIAPLCAALAGDTNSGSPDTQATPAPVISAGPAPVISSPAVTAPTKLPYGVEDVLKLSRAQVGEEVILNYVQSSGTIYNLTPKEIVYLKEQGVSEKVINAMLDQRKRVEMAAQSTAAPAPAVAPNTPDNSAVQGPNAAPGAPVYAEQNATYAEAPLTPPASSVYVIPYSAGYPYYAPYAYSYPYYGGWYGPSVSLGFRFGGHGYYGRGYYGGHGYGGHSYGGHSSGGHAGGGHGGHR
jgi:hypothetical protein